MECVEPSLLPGICIVHVSLPCSNVLITQALETAIFVFTDSLGLVHTRAVRRARVEAAFNNLIVDLCVQREVVSDGGAEVCELADSIEFIVVDGNYRRCFCILSQDIRLLQTDVQSEILTGKQSINDWSSSWVWATTATSSTNSMSLMSTSRTFVLALRRARLKSLQSDRVRR